MTHHTLKKEPAMARFGIRPLVIAACTFAAGAAMAGDNTRNDAARAIDGDLGTVTYLTPGRTTGFHDSPRAVVARAPAPSISASSRRVSSLNGALRRPGR